MAMLDSNRGWADGEGLTKVATNDFGQWDLCLAQSSPATQETPSFTGKFCMFEAHLPLPPDNDKFDRLNFSGTPMADTWFEQWETGYKALYYMGLNGAICMPSTCGREEIQGAFNRQFQRRNMSGIRLRIWDQCDTREDFELTVEVVKNFPLRQKICILLLVTVVGMVAVATAICYLFGRESMPSWMRAFDAASNAMLLFQRSKDREAAKKLGFVHGIRFGYLWGEMTLSHRCLVGLTFFLFLASGRNFSCRIRVGNLGKILGKEL